MLREGLGFFQGFFYRVLLVLLHGLNIWEFPKIGDPDTLPY